jgi:allantoate deiminase
MEREVIARCRSLAACTEEPGFITRTFLSEPMHAVHTILQAWMEQAGMSVWVDAAGNLRGRYAARGADAPCFYIGSHLDTVPHGGAFDGVLGVVMGIALLDLLAGRRLKFHVEVVGFSEEEGVRFGIPFIGSRAFIGDPVCDPRVDAAIRAFGLDPSRVGDAQAGDHALGYLEFHIEQGPVLEERGLPVAVVQAIAGQSRLEVLFRGQSNHAGTTPMHFRRDALAGMAEWISAVEREAGATPGLVATVGRIGVEPGATNVIPGTARASLDVRHAADSARKPAVERLLEYGGQIAARRGLGVSCSWQLDQPAVAMDPGLSQMLECAIAAAGYPVHRMMSGAGHDAMIVARRMPAAMLFLRSPGGISHHPDEAVLEGDVTGALSVAIEFLEGLEAHLG